MPVRANETFLRILDLDKGKMTVAENAQLDFSEIYAWLSADSQLLAVLSGVDQSVRVLERGGGWMEGIALKAPESESVLRFRFSRDNQIAACMTRAGSRQPALPKTRGATVTGLGSPDRRSVAYAPNRSWQRRLADR